MEQSSNSSFTPADKDPVLWRIAHKRAGFKRHVVTYIIMNAFFWVIWFFTSQNHSYDNSYHFRSGYFPWPVWPMFGWGIGLFFHFMGAYVYPKDDSVEREYQKLKNKISK